MVSGKTADFVFKNTTSAGEVAEYVYNNWPEGTYEKCFFKDSLINDVISALVQLAIKHIQFLFNVFVLVFRRKGVKSHVHTLTYGLFESVATM